MANNLASHEAADPSASMMPHALALDRQSVFGKAERPTSECCVAAAAPYAAFYINLDRSSDRRNQIENEIVRHGHGHIYKRFSAADGNLFKLPNQGLTPGEMGCLLSHLFLLQQRLDSDAHVHVVEDDAVFSRFTVPTIAAAVQTGMIDHFDVLFTDSFVQPASREYREYKQLFDRSVERDASGTVVRVHPTIVNYHSATASYIVNRRSIPKLIDLLVRSLAGGATIPIDLAIRNAAAKGEIRIGCLFPFVTTFRIDGIVENTIDRRPNDLLSRLLLQLGRHSFFVDCHHRALCELAHGLLLHPDPRPEPASGDDPHKRLLDQIIAFCASELFVPH